LDAHSALSLIESGLNQCRIAVDQDAGLLFSLFTAGLVGGLTHCAGMCGPFVLAQVSARLEAVPASRMSEFHRLTGAAVLPYHLGRGTTYAALGAVAASVAGMVAALPGLRWVSVVLLAFAALFFLAYALKGLKGWLPSFNNPLERWWSAIVSRLAGPLFGSPIGWRGYALGLALGFIPCGLLYGAIAVAAASGNPISGALGMVAFTLGTLPALIAVGLAGHAAGRAWRGAVARAAPVIMMVNAGVLGYMAWQLVA